MEKITEEPEVPVPPVVPTGPLKKLYYPCEEGRWRISQYFGERPNIYTQSRGHNGLDWAIPVGQPIYCAADGIVEVAREDRIGYGRHIRIRHSHGITIYGHMSRNDVKVGDRVKAKQVIGLSGGATTDPFGGYTTGPHLHFEYRWDITAPQVPGGFKYNAVDPFPLLVSHVKENALFKIQVKVTALNVRNGPSVSNSHLHVIRRNEVYGVYEERNGWYRIGKNRWCSGNSQFVEKLGEDKCNP
jgi:murein DD-endopeptidase MepM/ murein hydrolase activator NlpD